MLFSSVVFSEVERHWAHSQANLGIDRKMFKNLVFSKDFTGYHVLIFVVAKQCKLIIGGDWNICGLCMNDQVMRFGLRL